MNETCTANICVSRVANLINLR